MNIYEVLGGKGREGDGRMKNHQANPREGFVWFDEVGGFIGDASSDCWRRPRLVRARERRRRCISPPSRARKERSVISVKGEIDSSETR